MPQTLPTLNPRFGIRLSGSRSEYAPGDTIAGCVFRKAHTVSPSASVDISLHGRAKSKMSVGRGDGSSRIYRGRFNLINVPDNTQTVFEGPLHIPSADEEQIWPFSLVIPTYVDPSTLGANYRQHSYLSIEELDVATHDLPSTFNSRQYGTRSHKEGFVEYYLQAEMRLTTQGSTDTHEAILPVVLKTRDLNPPIVDFKLKSYRNSHSVASHRLVPGKRNEQLSLSQKTQQLFGSSRVPTMHFELQVNVPTVIQLENPNPLPFQVRVVPNWEKSSKILNRAPPLARVTELSMVIVARTEVKCSSGVKVLDADTRGKLDLRLEDAIAERQDPIFVPCTPDGPPGDVGEVLNLRIGRCGRLGKPSEYDTLNPSFKTYNICHDHCLVWSMTVRMAGVDTKTRAVQPITIIAASDDGVEAQAATGLQHEETWMTPPADAQAPPSFFQVQQEDVRRRESEGGNGVQIGASQS
ncbi:hypothetical protein AK830_g3624 [Neonectria ditissima]|uniref:Arrestin-like N-terminal domain-containing protein n=1 Tax=Neonectria ditissima TaxID=78410 RepID=A0A0P7BQ10_9HYPO|nr:hypothetical protein AK830_g3624 [Neonectria ditissima]